MADASRGATVEPLPTPGGVEIENPVRWQRGRSLDRAHHAGTLGHYERDMDGWWVLPRLDPSQSVVMLSRVECAAKKPK